MPSWAKIHTDILGDPKLMRAARKGAKGLELLPWLIAFAKQAEDNGRLTVGGDAAEPIDIAALIPSASSRSVAVCCASLLAIGVLVRDPDGALRLAAWDRRSGMKPSDSAEAIRDRVQRFREKKSNAESNGKHETPSNALQGVSTVTPCNATEEKKSKKREEEKRPHIGADAPDVPFDDVWHRYPRRAGHNPRRAAERAWNARLRAGATAEQMLAGLERYRAYVTAADSVGTRFVMQAATFFGPDAPYDDPWTIPVRPALTPEERADRELEERVRRMQEAEREHEGDAA